MALLYLDSFGQYGNSAHSDSGDMKGDFLSAQDGTWTCANLATGRSRVMMTTGGVDTYGHLTFSLPSDYSTLVIGFRVHYVTATATIIPLVEFNDGGSVMAMIFLDYTTGQLQFHSSNGPYTNILTSTGGTSAGTSDYWECKVVFHNSTGSVTFYKNGVQDSQVTSVDTIYTGSLCDAVQLLGDRWNANKAGYSDFYIDSATVHGDVKVTYEPCDTSGTESDWTPAASTNESQVDEYDPDDGTTYNESDTNGETDSLAHGVTTDINAVLGVQAVCRATKVDSNNGSIKLGIKHSGSEDLSGSKDLNTSYEYRNHVVEDVPAGTGWTETQSDAAEVVIENVST